nr:HNH endonuclease [Mycobacterium gordonae]
MTRLIRWAATSHDYLAVFDQAKPLALFHTKRFANLAQRLMLLAQHGGCTKPGCNAPALHSQAHHISGWRNTHCTDIHDLTLACGVDNRLAEKGWTTRKNAKGDTEWIPPAHLGHGQPRVPTFIIPRISSHPPTTNPIDARGRSAFGPLPRRIRLHTNRLRAKPAGIVVCGPRTRPPHALLDRRQGDAARRTRRDRLTPEELTGAAWLVPNHVALQGCPITI